jgi:hypothetical protein
MKAPLESLSIDELVSLYAAIPKELKRRGVIRSNNFLGDLGEFIAIGTITEQLVCQIYRPLPPALKTLML